MAKVLLIKEMLKKHPKCWLKRDGCNIKAETMLRINKPAKCEEDYVPCCLICKAKLDQPAMSKEVYEQRVKDADQGKANQGKEDSNQTAEANGAAEGIRPVAPADASGTAGQVPAVSG